ncbi:hypothetical protein ACIBJE_12950 [Micromonospora sp. NPDC050187]|uniref:hypothetical protein n=1 Tax=Micromonospora sp. NPDC050187 TaxID=3364277 RepID=UPI0037AFF010
MAWACWSSPLRPYIRERAWPFNRSSSASVTGGRAGVDRPTRCSGRWSSVASYACLSRTFSAYRSWSFFSSARVLPMALVAAERAV